jgi:hypothetical protein
MQHINWEMFATGTRKCSVVIGGEQATDCRHTKAVEENISRK